MSNLPLIGVLLGVLGGVAYVIYRIRSGALTERDLELATAQLEQERARRAAEEAADAAARANRLKELSAKTAAATGADDAARLLRAEVSTADPASR